MLKCYYPEGFLCSSLQNQKKLRTPINLSEAAAKGEILEAPAVMCDAEHNLIVNLGCMNGIIVHVSGSTAGTTDSGNNTHVIGIQFVAVNCHGMESSISTPPNKYIHYYITKAMTGIKIRCVALSDSRRFVRADTAHGI